MNVHHPFVGAQLKLLTRFLVDVWGFENGVNFLLGGQGNWPTDHSARHFDGLDNFLRLFIDQVVVVGLEFNANTMAHNGI